jgi:type II restriction enzyme
VVPRRPRATRKSCRSRFLALQARATERFQLTSNAQGGWLAGMKITSAVVEKFQSWHKEAWNDKEWASATRERMAKREGINKEILELFRAFAAGKLALAAFKTTFDKKTRKEWDGFGLKGMSGAMFLNMMTLHIPDQEDLAAKLKQTLLVPGTETEGRNKMAGFHAYLNEVLSRHHIPVRKLQPRRTPFFLSAFWHMQNRESWPVFYESAREVLRGEQLLTESNDPVADFFQFRSAWLQLRQAMNVTPWDFELLCARVSEAAKAVVNPEPETPAVQSTDNLDEPVTDSTHTEVQWLLAELGQKLGCKVWIATNDHAKQWNGQKLEKLSIRSLPNLGMGEDAQKIISLIDVLWLKGGKQVVAAFEVETTTRIFSGLLRMADLSTTCPNLNILCFIVVPKSRESLVIKQLSRPTFQSLDLNRRCGFITIEDLMQESPGMMKWAPDAATVKELAKFVDDVSE